MVVHFDDLFDVEEGCGGEVFEFAVLVAESVENFDFVPLVQLLGEPVLPSLLYCILQCNSGLATVAIIAFGNIAVAIVAIVVVVDFIVVSVLFRALCDFHDGDGSILFSVSRATFFFGVDGSTLCEKNGAVCGPLFAQFHKSDFLFCHASLALEGSAKTVTL